MIKASSLHEFLGKGILATAGFFLYTEKETALFHAIATYFSDMCIYFTFRNDALYMCGASCCTHE